MQQVRAVPCNFFFSGTMGDRSPSAKNGRAGERPLNVQVAVRCRPPNAKERLEPHFNIVQCDENAGQVTTPGTCGVVRKAAAATGEKTYSFDYVFGPTSTQKQVYDTVCSRAVDEVIRLNINFRPRASPSGLATPRFQLTSRLRANSGS